MEHGHVVPAEPQVLEAAAQQFRLDEQVRENDAKRPLANRLRQLVQHRYKLRLALRLGLFQDVVDGRQVGRVAARRNVPHDAPGNAGKPNRISLLKGDVGDRPGDSPGVLDLRHPVRPEFHRSARIEHQAAPQVGVGLELLDEEAVGVPVGTPVQPPQIVTGNILAILRKFHARAPMRTRMPARNRPQHRPTRKEREARKA